MLPCCPLWKEYGKMFCMRVLLSPGVGEIEEKKSKFIAHLKAVHTEEEAVAFFDEIKKKYWDAKHNCTAFILGQRGENTRCNDDKEPAQTAGRPMLNVLQHANLRDVACVVTRYFGGTLLGTGGLIKAYSDAVKDALDKSTFAEEIEGVKFSFTLDYDAYGRVQREFENRKIVLTDTEFTEKISASVEIPASEEEMVRKLLTECTLGRAVIGESRNCMILKETTLEECPSEE